MTTYAIRTAAHALATIREPSFAAEFARLLNGCPWATPFQRLEFASSWYSAYSGAGVPLVVTARDDAGTLQGLFAGAYTADRIVVVGGRQAEYPAWLSAPALEVEVFDGAIGLIERTFGTSELLLRYLPPRFPVAALLAKSKYRNRILSRPFARPLMRLSADSATESLRKKSNKSKLNRLKRLGGVRLEVLDSLAAFEEAFDAIIAQFDRRQLSANGLAPFASDPCKRAFHIEMMRNGLLHVSLLRVANRIAAAHIGAKGNGAIHLSIVSFESELAAESPNKLLLLLLAQRLATDGIEFLDLTPGGDAWKDRFATEFDEVVELRLMKSAWSRTIGSLNRRGRRAAKAVVSRFLQASSLESA